MDAYLDMNGGWHQALPPGVELAGMHLGPRTKRSHPYSYDPVLQYKKYAKTPQTAHASYSDRLAQWDHDKFRRLCEQHFKGKNGDRGGDWFYQRHPADIEAFLRDYFDQPALELVRVEEQCNVASGFPLWVFWYMTS